MHWKKEKMINNKYMNAMIQSRIVSNDLESENDEDSDAKGSELECLFQGCDGAGGGGGDGGLYRSTRTLVRFLGLIGCRPAPRLVHGESRPFSVTTPFNLFSNHPFESACY